MANDMLLKTNTVKFNGRSPWLDEMNCFDRTPRNLRHER